MRNYPYKVRVLAALDSLFSPKSPKKAISKAALEHEFETICDNHDISLPTSWKTRTSRVLNDLVQDRWLIRHSNETYTPSARLRKVVADEKLRLNVSQSDHDLDTFAMITNALKAGQSDANSDTSTPASALAKARRNTGRASLPARLRHDSSSPRSIAASDEIVVQTQPTSNVRSATRTSDASPLVVITNDQAPNRRVAKVSSSKIPGSNRRKSQGVSRREANRRHTIAVIDPADRQIPAGKPEEIQFLPFRATLSTRTRRALRRNGISEEQNDLEREERSYRKKSREEIAMLREEYQKSTRRLAELQRELDQLRSAPSQEPEPFRLNAIPEELEEEDTMGDVDMEDTFGNAIPYDNAASDAESSVHEDYTTIHTPAAMSRQNSSTGDSPISKRDKRINELMMQIEHLKQDIKLQQEDAENSEIFHDAEEQLMLDERSHLQDELEQLRSPPTDGPEFEEDAEMMESSSVQFTSTQTRSLMQIRRRLFDDSGIADSSPMMIEEVDPRITELEDENERLLIDLDRANAKLQGLEEELALVSADSEEARTKAHGLKQERDSLHTSQQGLQEQIDALLFKDRHRLENVSINCVQTDEIIDHEKESLIVDLQDRNDRILELQEMISAATSEKNRIQEVVDDCRDQIAALERKVETGEAATEDAREFSARLQGIISDLEEKNSELSDDLVDMQSEISTLHEDAEAMQERIEALNLEIAGYKVTLENKDSLIGTLENQITDLRHRTGEFEKNIDSHQQEINTLRVTVAERGETISELEHVNVNLQQHSAELEIALSGLKNHVSQLDQDKLDLVGGLERRTEENKILIGKISGLEDEKRTLSAARDALIDEKRTLLSEIEQLHEAARSSNISQAEFQETISNLKSEVTTLEYMITEKEDVIQEFEKEARLLQDRIAALETAAAIARQEKASFEQDVATLSQRITDLSVQLEESRAGKGVLEAELTEARVQLAAFQQSASTTSLEIEGMEAQAANLRAQVEASNKAIHVVNTEKQHLIDQKAQLNDRVEELEDEVDALKSEREVMRRDIAKNRADFEKLQSLLAIANTDNEALKNRVTALEEQVEHLKKMLSESSDDNIHLNEQIAHLTSNINQINRTAAQSDEQQKIILQKIQPYVNGEMSLDMAVEEVLTELVMARNSAAENQEVRNELEQKIRTLVCLSSDDSPQELVDRLTDRFKEVRRRVQALSDRRRNDANSPFANLDIGSAEWQHSNDHVLQSMDRLIEGLDRQLNTAKDNVASLSASLQSAKQENQDLKTDQQHIANVVGIDLQSNISESVEKYLESLRAQIERLEAKVDELDGVIEEKNKEVEEWEGTAQEEENRADGLQKRLDLALEEVEKAEEELDDARETIEELQNAAEENEQKLSEFEQEMQKAKALGSLLGEQLEQQDREYAERLRKAQQEKVLALGAMQNKLAMAIDAKNYLELHLQQISAERESALAESERIRTESVAQIDSVYTELQAKQKEHDDETRRYLQELDEAKGKISDLTQDIREADAKHDVEIANLQTEMTRKHDAHEKVVRDLTEKGDALTAALKADIQNKADEIENLSRQLAELHRIKEEERTQMQLQIDGLRNELSRVREEAKIEEKRLNEVAAEQETRVSELEAYVKDLKGWLDEAEESEAALTDKLNDLSSENQAISDESAKMRHNLQTQIRNIEDMLSKTKDESVSLDAEHRATITTLHKLLQEKDRTIASLNHSLSEKGTALRLIQLKIAELESSQSQLERELALEREKGLATVQSMQKEAERFMSRFGDIKNSFVVQQMQARKRSREDEDEQMSSSVGPVAAPPSPDSTRASAPRHIVTTTTESVKKRRRQYDSGVGLEQEDEGFEGSTTMSMAY